METIWIGADPGKTGAFVALDGDGYPVAQTLMPILGKGTKTKERVDFSGLITFIERVSAVTAAPSRCMTIVVEQVNSFRDDTPLTAFRLGETNQAIHDLAAAKSIALEEIRPAVWQKAMLSGLPRDSYQKRKASAVLACKRRWPNSPLAKLLDVKKNQGMADAALVGLAGKLRAKAMREQLGSR